MPFMCKAAPAFQAGAFLTPYSALILAKHQFSGNLYRTCFG